MPASKPESEDDFDVRSIASLHSDTTTDTELIPESEYERLVSRGSKSTTTTAGPTKAEECQTIHRCICEGVPTSNCIREAIHLCGMLAAIPRIQEDDQDEEEALLFIRDMVDTLEDLSKCNACYSLPMFRKLLFSVHNQVIGRFVDLENHIKVIHFGSCALSESESRQKEAYFGDYEILKTDEFGSSLALFGYTQAMRYWELLIKVVDALEDHEDGIKLFWEDTKRQALRRKTILSGIVSEYLNQPVGNGARVRNVHW